MPVEDPGSEVTCVRPSLRTTSSFCAVRPVGDLETNESVGGGDAGAQAERAMANVELLLKEAGARLEDICKVMVYLTDDRHRDAVYEVLGRRLAGVYPCSAGVVVSGLARPEWVASIDVTAVIPARR